MKLNCDELLARVLNSPPTSCAFPTECATFIELRARSVAALESLAAQNAAQAEEIAKLKGHAEAMANAIEWMVHTVGLPQYEDRLDAYRRDYPEES